MNDLGNRLSVSARDFLRRALRAYQEGDWPVSAAFAGIGAEQSCKAYLGSLHPVLISERATSDAAHFDNLLHLLGLPHARPGHRLRTTSANDALRRLQQVLPSAKDLPIDTLKAVFDSRSDALHYGSVDATAVRAELAAALRLAALVFDALNMPGEERWDSYGPLVVAIIDETLAAARQETQRLLARSRSEYERLRAAHPTEESFAATVAALQQRWITTWHESSARGGWTCPACGNQAQVAGREEYEDDTPYEPEDFGQPALWARRLHIEQLDCPVCGLRLDNPDALEAAGVEQLDWEPTSDPPPSISDWEPDEDWLRGR